ncbi:Hint domain-containing protein [Rhodobacteraceae bacterium]|nr:Hint domain-containing protein [Paracoccaceae bacterium]
MTMAKKIVERDVVKAGTTGLCTGANLRTPCGERHVEFLRPGDLVVTRDNGLQPVKLIWTETFLATEIAADPSLAPVLLATRAIGPMMPKKPLKVGGAHRLLIPGWRIDDEEDTENCLVAARDVDGLEVGSETGIEDLVYYNIVFETPQIFCVNGMPVESFTPTEDSVKIIPKDALEALQKAFPDLGPKFAKYPKTSYKRRASVSYTPDYA